MVGFAQLVSAAPVVAGLVSGAPIRASLVPMALGMPVFFQFNPQKVTVGKRASTEGGRGMITNSFEDAVKAVGNFTIKMSDVNFAGYLTKSTCDQLIHWATPMPVPGTGVGAAVAALGGPSMPSLSGGIGGLAGSMASAVTTRSPTVSGTYAGMGTIYKLPVLLFNWGGGGGPIGLSYKVVLEKVDIVYERFNAYGVPVWAKVGMDLKEYAEELPPTNPTSGGPPGRTRHVVTAGETVVRIANQSYGTPLAWRAVAEANGLDDPLRVKPGVLLDLPGVSELEQQGSAS